MAYMHMGGLHQVGASQRAAVLKIKIKDAKRLSHFCAEFPGGTLHARSGGGNHS